MRPSWLSLKSLKADMRAAVAELEQKHAFERG